MADILIPIAMGLLMAVLLGAYLYYVVGIGKFRLDGILHVVEDAGGHGLHLFGYRVGTTRYSPKPPYRFYHVFIRPDGSKQRSYVAVPGDRKDYWANPERRTYLAQSTERMAGRTGLALGLPPGELAAQEVEVGRPARILALGRVFDIRKLEDGFAIECRAAAEQAEPAWTLTT
jgi:hypothetical protein